MLLSEGGNENKRFVVLTGDGDNGKSVVVQLCELTFGDYAWKFEQELLVRAEELLWFRSPRISTG